MRTNSVASQSSSSGCEGGSPWRPKFSVVFTSPVPKCCCQSRFTATRAVSGLSGETSQRARPRRLRGRAGRQRRRGKPGRPDRPSGSCPACRTARASARRPAAARAGPPSPSRSGARPRARSSACEPGPDRSSAWRSSGVDLLPVVAVEPILLRLRSPLGGMPGDREQSAPTASSRTSSGESVRR